MEIPMTLGLIGPLIAQTMAVAGALAAWAADCTIKVYLKDQ